MKYENTDELLAIKFPNSHHLLPDFEKACAEITCHQGKGRFGMDMQGLDSLGRLIVQYIDVQSRWFRKGSPEPKQKKTS